MHLCLKQEQVDIMLQQNRKLNGKSFNTKPAHKGVN